MASPAHTLRHTVDCTYNTTLPPPNLWSRPAWCLPTRRCNDEAVRCHPLATVGGHARFPRPPYLSTRYDAAPPAMQRQPSLCHIPDMLVTTAKSQPRVGYVALLALLAVVKVCILAYIGGMPPGGLIFGARACPCDKRASVALHVATALVTALQCAAAPVFWWVPAVCLAV